MLPMAGELWRHGSEGSVAATQEAGSALDSPARGAATQEAGSALDSPARGAATQEAGSALDSPARGAATQEAGSALDSPARGAATQEAGSALDSPAREVSAAEAVGVQVPKGERGLSCDGHTRSRTLGILLSRIHSPCFSRESLAFPSLKPRLLVPLRFGMAIIYFDAARFIYKLNAVAPCTTAAPTGRHPSSNLLTPMRYGKLRRAARSTPKDSQ
jgi:hypothetical protein